MRKVTYISKDGLAALQAEHLDLVTSARQAVARLIGDAIALGDLSENADYESAKREQAFLEGRIATIERLISEATLIEDVSASDRVVVGSRVTIGSDQGEEVYTLVGTSEARPAAGLISHDSPIGRAMLGKRVGEQAMAATPGGSFPFRILAVA